jgi:phosphoglycolate phosphatase
MKPYLLFDFDGTVADSIGKLFTMINELAPRYGYQPISEETFSKLRNLNLRQSFRHLKIPLYKLGQAIPIVLHEYRKIIPELDPCPGILPVLETLKKRGIPMALISSNQTENVQEFLDRHGIDCFAWVEGTGGILKKHNKITRQIVKHGLIRKDVIYIGDESRDIKAARKSRVKVISVTWGFHSAEHLARHKPDYLAASPDELLKIVLNISASTGV